MRVGDEQAPAGGRSWQMVCNLTISWIGSAGQGGLMDAEPRSSPDAWATCQRWIKDGATPCAAKPKPGRGGYISEWAIGFDQCLEAEPGEFHNPSGGDHAVGLNTAIGDLDEKERGAGRLCFHREDWFAGPKNFRTQLCHWGTLWIIAKPH